MTRFDILRTYQVEEGVIRTPGEFEGQALYVPYFWQRYLAGDASEVGSGVVMFAVQESDRAQFPELGNRMMVRLRPDGMKILEA